jgi:type VI secretion system secreted protein Hcp
MASAMPRSVLQPHGHDAPRSDPPVGLESRVRSDTVVQRAEHAGARSIMKNRIRSLVFLVCMATVTLLPFSEAHAALNAYLNLKGQKQGDIKGSVTKKGNEGAIQVIAVSHEIVSPRDAASGLPTGKRQHKPLVIRKQIDKSTPVLNSMLVNNENIQSWELGVYMPNAKGSESLGYTITLTDASIASIRMITDADGNLFEEVTFTYKKIEWTWTDGGITAMDDWEARK